MGFWNRCFRCSERLVCYIKRWKSLFDDLFSQSMTWEYRGLQEVTGGYKGLQGVTKGYKGLQGVTRGKRGWQGVTKDYRNFFLTRTFQDTFSRSILHKSQSWRNLKFLTKTMDQNLWKNSNFAFFINSCFYSLQRLLFYLEPQQSLFLDVVLINTKDEKTSTFRPKSCTIRFGKRSILPTFKFHILYCLERLVF